MTTTALAAFFPVAVTLVLVPGVNNLIVLRETVARGVVGGLAAVAGTSVGILAWSAAVAAGLGALAANHPTLFGWLQVGGAALLVVTGVRGLLGLLRLLRAGDPAVAVESWPGRGPGRGERSEVVGAGDGSTNGRPGVMSFRTAAATSLVNPRCPVTAVSVLPQFVVPGSAAAVTVLSLGMLWTVLAGAWNVVGIALAHRGRGLLNRPAARRVVEGVGAASLVAVGVSVAAGVHV